MYEVCKEMDHDGLTAWAAIAWADVGMYAEQVASALHAINGGRYAIFEGETIAGIEKALAAGTVGAKMQVVLILTQDHYKVYRGGMSRCQ